MSGGRSKKLKTKGQKYRLKIKSFPLTLALSRQGRENKSNFLSLDGRGLR
jgi:hypothetical protein